MKKLNAVPKGRLLLFGLPVFGLVLGLLGYFALVAPQKSKANRLSAEIDAVRSQVVAATPQRHVKPPSVHAVDIFRLTKAMPDSADVPGLLLNLSRVASASGVSLQSVKPAAAVPLPAGYGALPVSVTVSGTFGHVSSFLAALRHQVSIGPRGGLHVSGRLLVPDEVAFTSGNDRTVSATLSLNAFIYGLAPPPSTTTTTTTTPSGSTG